MNTLLLDVTWISYPDKSLAAFFAPQSMRYLQEAGESTFVSPMSQWPQLAHWLDPDLPGQMKGMGNPVIHAIYGPTELFLYGVRFLILSFDWSAGTFKYVDYASVLKASGLGGDRFFEACVLAGFEGHSSTTLPSLSSTPNGASSHSFQNYIDARSGTSSDIATLLGGSESPKFQAFARETAFLRLNLILDLKAETRPFQRDLQGQISVASSPALDIKLPEYIYWLISNGTLSPQVINAFLSGSILETTPLVDSIAYHKLLSDLIDMRSRSIALLAQAMPPAAATKSVSTYRWYEPTQAVPVTHTTFKTFSKSCGGRSFVPNADIEEEMKRQNLAPLPSSISPNDPQAHVVFLQHLSLPFVVSVLEHAPKNYTAPPPHSTQPVFPHEILASVLTLTLEIYQYIGMGRSLNDLGKALKLVAPEHAAEAFAFLELLRSSHINGQALHPSTPESENDPELSLISRVFSIIGMKLTEKWAGPIDRELMAFNSLLRAVYRTARNVVEMSLVSITQSGRVTIATEYPHIAAKLPFFQESNTALGVVVSSFLLEEASDFQKRFAKIPSLKDDLLRGYAFWKDVQRMIESLQTSKATATKNLLPQELVDLFKSASQRLDTAFASL